MWLIALPSSLPNLAAVSCAFGFGVVYGWLSRDFQGAPRINLAAFSYEVSSICYSKTSKASAFKDFSVMKILSSFEIAFELLDANTAFSLRFEI